ACGATPCRHHAQLRGGARAVLAGARGPRRHRRVAPREAAMRLAGIADVHANAHALAAVLEACRGEASDGVLCLGDLVGYNAEPRQVLEMLGGREDVVLLAGNHDIEAASHTTEVRTSDVPGRIALGWTRAAL